MGRRVGGGIVLLAALSGCGGGPQGPGASDAGRDAAPVPDATPESGVEAERDAGAEPDAGHRPECEECGPGSGFDQPSIRDEIVTACYCAFNTYRGDYYDALMVCLAAGCNGLDVDACYEEALAGLDATPIALEAIDICEGRAEECAFQDCRFLAGFADGVLEDYLECLYVVDCGTIVPCVNVATDWCEVY